MNEALIGPAHPEHSAGIVAVIRSGFSPEILGATVYGCHGIVRFIEGQIGLPRAVAETTWTVATHATGSGPAEVIGCAEVRRSPHELLLNYISVLPAYRGAGLGRKMLLAAIADRQKDQRDMLLDVLTENEAANRWYERLGFQDQQRAEWWDLGPCSSLHGTARSRRAGYLSGYPQASVTQREFGFSQFDVTTPDGRTTIGRLGEQWFRVTRAGALEDPAVAAALEAIDPGRHVLAILPADTLPTPFRDRARLVAQTMRKVMKVDELARGLREGR